MVTQPPAAKSEIRTVLPGLLLAMLLAMLDAMIISTSLPAVVADLGGFANLSWVVAIYLLTSTVSTPIWGKLGDMFGRKHLFVTAIIIFLAGSALSGLAPSMGALIAFRALQGVGAGGLIVGVVTIIGVLAPPQERGRYQSYIAALSAVATVGGPLLGGTLTDQLSWRWAFYINIPIGVVALILVLSMLRLPHTRIDHRIDFLGAAMLTVVTTAGILISVWGGTEYGWASPQILGLGVVVALGLVATVLVERRAAEPILPPKLFAQRDFAASLALGFLVGVALYGSITFIPLYQQNVQNATATSSGLLLLPILVGQLVTAIFSGRAMTSRSRYRPFALLGGAALTIGALLLSRLDTDTSRVVSALYMVVFGVGLGFLFQNVLVIAQNSVGQRDMGAASGSLTFFRTIGGTFGVSLFAAIFTNRVRASLADTLEPAQLTELTQHGGRVDAAAVEALPEATQTVYIDAVAHATQGVFGWAILFGVLTLLAAFLIKGAAPRQPAEDAPAAEPPTKEGAAPPAREPR